MSRKVWNWIYFIGFMIPVLCFFLSYVNVAAHVGDDSFIPLLSNIWPTIRTSILGSRVYNFMPVTTMGKVIVYGSSGGFSSFFTELSCVSCWTVGADFVIWLSIIHIVIDLFMLLSRCLSRLFAKFGGAD